MKPKDLKHPFSWHERRPWLEGRVFYVPAFYDRHHLFQFPAFSSPEIFGNSHPVHLEYCSGNGTWIVEKALAYPHLNWVAVEKDFERVRKIVSKTHNEKLANLFIICGEGLTFTREYLPSECVEQIYVNFPDPWPKEKHAKHRIFQLPFAKETARILRRGGKGIFVTDDPPYAEQICTVMLASGLWAPLHPPPHYLTECPHYGTSFFDTLWREMGRTIHYFEMQTE